MDSLESVSDAEEWREVTEGFRVIGFDADECEAITRLVAAVLHMGNLQFEVSATLPDFF